MRSLTSASRAPSKKDIVRGRGNLSKEMNN